jgi:hypothetical protein
VRRTLKVSGKFSSFELKILKKIADPIKVSLAEIKMIKNQDNTFLDFLWDIGCVWIY